MSKLPVFTDPHLLVGPENYDDAAVYKINDDQALVQTVDFLTPMVDDPFSFGQIAAANALSDVYAMGATPLTVMNIAAFPKCSDLEVLGEILRGGAEKIREAGAVLVGGHTVDDQEPKYGLAVTGVAHPKDVLINGGAKSGDSLMLTKTLGNGILATAIKAGMLKKDAEQRAIADMAALNKDAAAAMKEAGIHGVTDVTGFGFLGHLGEMARASRLSPEVWAEELPVWDEAKEFAQMGIIPAGCYSNRKHMDGRVSFGDEVPQFLQDIMFDPQTSGGLLMAVAPEKLERLILCLEKKNVGFRVIGEMKNGTPGAISVRGRRK